MIAVYCENLESRVLLGLDSLGSLTNSDEGFDLTYRCLCGEHGRMQTGTRSVETSGHFLV